MSNISKTQQEIYDLLCNMSGTDATNTITDFLGMQILTNDFAKFLIDEDFATEGDFSELSEVEYEEEEEEE